MAEYNLASKTILVTGASSGIGRATALELARAGSRVIAAARRSRLLEELQNECHRERLAVPDVISVDLARPGSETQIKDFLTAEGLRLNSLIHNAGFIEPARLEETSADNWNTTMEVNVNSAYRLYHTLYGFFEEKFTFAAVSSLAGYPGAEKFAGFGAYSAAKSALGGLTEVMAAELAEKGGRANALCPGAVDTEMLKKAAPHLKPGLTPHDVARHLLYLISDASAPLSGELIALK